MERIRISELRKAIETTRGATADPIQKETLDRLLKTIRVCPPQYLRITKMHEEVMKIRNSHQQMGNSTKLEIMQNFQEKTFSEF